MLYLPYSEDDELLTWIEDMVLSGRNAFRISSVPLSVFGGGSRDEDLDVISLFTGAQITEAGKQLHSRSAGGWIRGTQSASSLWMFCGCPSWRYYHWSGRLDWVADTVLVCTEKDS